MKRRSKSEEKEKEWKGNPFDPDKGKKEGESRMVKTQNGDLIELIKGERKKRFTCIRGKEIIVNRSNWKKEMTRTEVQFNIEKVSLVGLKRIKFLGKVKIEKVMEEYVKGKDLRPVVKEKEMMEFYQLLIRDEMTKLGRKVRSKKNARSLASKEFGYFVDLPKLIKYSILLQVVRLKEEGLIKEEEV